MCVYTYRLNVPKRSELSVNMRPIMVSPRKMVKKTETSQHTKCTCCFCGKTRQETSCGTWCCGSCMKTAAARAWTNSTTSVTTRRKELKDQ